jgi:hypothetical protein
MTQNTAVAERNPNALNLTVATAIGGTDITAGQGRAAFLPTSMGEAMEIAKLMAGGNFVPPHLRGVPGDCLAVVMQAARWGMDPFAVANKTYFVNNRMGYEAQLVNAVVNSSNVLNGRLKVDWSGEGNALECFVTGYIKGDPDAKTRRVKLNTIKVRNSPLWQADPEQQIGYYATRAWARLHTPEVLLGVYTPDELEAMEPRNPVEASTMLKPLSSAMLAQQAGATVEQADLPPLTERDIGRHDDQLDRLVEPEDVQDAEIEEVAEAEAAALSEAAEQTLADIDGPLEQAEDEWDGVDPTSPLAPGADKLAEIKAAIDSKATVIDLNTLWKAEEAHVDFMPEVMREYLIRQFATAKEAMQRRAQA